MSALGPTSEEVEIMGHNYGLCSVAIEVRPSTVVAETSAGSRRAVAVCRATRKRARDEAEVLCNILSVSVAWHPRRSLHYHHLPLPMDAYTQITPLWDNSDISQLPDSDFLALLQKQFPTVDTDLSFMGGYANGVNPQTISSYPLPSLTPPSEDSSPSPPGSSNNDQQNDDSADYALKRKASDEDFSDGPTQKSQNTGTLTSSFCSCVSHRRPQPLRRRAAPLVENPAET